jgi:RNA polymerase sigma-70 factor, ECF subfamily
MLRRAGFVHGFGRLGVSNSILDRPGPLARVVYASALRVLGDNNAAQDVVQDVFVELWAHPDRYDPAAGTLRTYLAVLARHRAVDVVRSELRRVTRQELSCRLMPAPSAAGPGDEVVAAETASLVRAAVQLLPGGPRPSPTRRRCTS